MSYNSNLFYFYLVFIECFFFYSDKKLALDNEEFIIKYIIKAEMIKEINYNPCANFFFLFYNFYFTLLSIIYFFPVYNFC